MSIEEQLKSLQARFLRCDSMSLYNAACVKGGYILKNMVQDKTIRFSKHDAKFWRDYFSENVGLDQQDLHFRSGFQLAADSYCETNEMSIVWERRNESVSVGQQNSEPRVLAEKMAAFCDEIIHNLNAPSVDDRDNELDPIALVRAIVNKVRKMKKLSQPQKGAEIASQVDDELWEMFSSARRISKEKFDYFETLVRDCENHTRGAPQWLKG